MIGWEQREGYSATKGTEYSPKMVFWLYSYFLFLKRQEGFESHLVLSIRLAFECPQQGLKKGIQFSKIIVSDSLLVAFQKQSDKYLITRRAISDPCSWAGGKGYGDWQGPQKPSGRQTSWTLNCLIYSADKMHKVSQGENKIWSNQTTILTLI